MSRSGRPTEDKPLPPLYAMTHAGVESVAADDLDTIRSWTAKKPDWDQLFKLHHKLRPKTKGRPTYHVVCQMQGEHGFRRADARAAFTEGLAGKIPHGWHYNN